MILDGNGLEQPANGSRLSPITSVFDGAAHWGFHVSEVGRHSRQTTNGQIDGAMAYARRSELPGVLARPGEANAVFILAIMVG